MLTPLAFDGKRETVDFVHIRPTYPCLSLVRSLSDNEISLNHTPPTNPGYRTSDVIIRDGNGF